MSQSKSFWQIFRTNQIIATYLVKTTAITLTFLFSAPAGKVEAAAFKKDFFSNNVLANAPILGGATVQTWADDDDLWVVDSHLIYQPPGGNPVISTYLHCRFNTDFSDINGGFPIRATGETVDPDPMMGSLGGWNPAPVIASDFPVHRFGNWSTADINVGKRVDGAGPIVTVRQGRGQGLGQIALVDSVQTVLEGDANAGPPIDGDNCHSADSFAAVNINAVKTFQVMVPGARPTIQAIGRNTMVGGIFQVQIGGPFGAPIGGNRDPYFVTVTDLDTGQVTVEEVMVQTLDWADALYSLDDSGIRLTINQENPESFVSLSFSSESPWVLNPYDYGARLDVNGLTAFGETPLSGWEINTSGDIVEAFFPFGAEGLPFDYAEVLPPESLFIENNNYTYDQGANNGAFEVITRSVPEQTSALGLLTFGALGAASTLKRKLKPSQSTEKETTKVG